MNIFLLTNCQNYSIMNMKRLIFSYLNIYVIIFLGGENMGIQEYLNISKNLKRIRKEKGLTQRELAKKAGIVYSTYSNYENGNRLPKPETIQDIANALNVSTLDLIEVPFKDSLNSDSAPPRPMTKDVSDILSNTEELLRQEGLMFDGEPISEESINSIISAMKIGMEMAKQNNKKYTPNKYKQKSSHEQTTIKNSSSKEHLTLMAAHNDNADDPEELEKIYEDIERLKSFSKNPE